MPPELEDSGFLSRWSRRKTQVRQGVAPAEAVVVGSASGLAVAAQPIDVPVAVQAVPPVAAPSQVGFHPDTSDGGGGGPSQPAEPLPTLADVAELTRDSDFSRFVAPSVQPDVKNAALAKLFSDPHFNVMDGLDTYIDDYSQPDPLPPGMLRQLLQSHVLGLFDHETPAATAAEAPVADASPAAATAASVATPNLCASDENTDLQLQPDDDAGCPSAATGPTEDAGRTR